VIECDQVRTVSETRLDAVLGRISEPVLAAIGKALKVSLALE
jgi:mRNA-degrading endonuclease toxin of MazEF toxin-antitoxin module